MQTDRYTNKQTKSIHRKNDITQKNFKHKNTLKSLLFYTGFRKAKYNKNVFWMKKRHLRQKQ